MDIFSKSHSNNTSFAPTFDRHIIHRDALANQRINLGRDVIRAQSAFKAAGGNIAELIQAAISCGIDTRDQIIGSVPVRSTGSKTYYLRYTDAHGRQKQHKIARVGDVPFSVARKEAIRLRSEVVLGRDPSAQKAERKAVPLFESVADDHIRHARTYMKSIKTLEGYMKRIKARWGKLRLTEIRSQDITAWSAELHAEGLGPATRLKILMFSFASAAIAAGIDLYHVGKLLGHQNVSSTSRYGHIRNITLMGAVEAGATTLNLGNAAP